MSAVAAALATVSVLASAAPTTTYSADLSFTSSDQSMWGTGQATQLDKTSPPLFFGTSWDKSGQVGGFVGGPTQIINPLWLLWNLCPFFCPAEPAKYLSVDTKTGAEVHASTQGRVGLELGVKVDSGSVNAAVNYNAKAVIPNASDVKPGEFFNLNPQKILLGNSLSSQFPTMSAELSVVLEAQASFGASGCLLGGCGSGSFTTGMLGGTQTIVSFNKDGQGGVEYFGGKGLLSDILDAAVATGQVSLPTGFPAVLEVPAPGGFSTLATITGYLPQPNTSGGLDPSKTKLTSQGQDSLLDLSIDLDNVIATGLGLPGLFGGAKDIGGGFGISYNLINVEIGPQLDLMQSLELTPTLLVDLDFSRAVNVQGQGLVNSVHNLAWDALPDMAFLGDTSVTPTFHLAAFVNGQVLDNAAALFDQLFIDIDGNIKVDLLDVTFSTPIGDLHVGIGNLIDQSFDLFTTPPFYSQRFAMAGFNPVKAEAFLIDVVPEPGTIVLLVSALLIMVSRHGRPARGAA